MGGVRWALRRAVPNLLEEVPLPDAVAVIDASLANVERRMEARSRHSSRADEWRTEGVEELSRASALLGEIQATVHDVAGRRPSMRVISLRNDVEGNIEAIARPLAGEIETMLRSKLAGPQSPPVPAVADPPTP